MTTVPCRFSTSEIPALLHHEIEGTPFVPFAMILDLMARMLESSDKEILFDAKVNIPVMLRKNRPRSLLLSYNETEASLHDENKNIYASLSHINDCKKENIYPSYASKPPFCRIERDQLYPDILFHGPTFQGIFNPCVFERSYLRVEVEGFTSQTAALGRFQTDQSIPVVLADLTFQVAGLHLLLTRQMYGLPSAGRIFVSPAARKLIDGEHEKVDVIITSEPTGEYNLLAQTLTGAELFRCEKLQFQSLNRAVDSAMIAVLSSLFHFDNPNNVKE